MERHARARLLPEVFYVRLFGTFLPTRVVQKIRGHALLLCFLAQETCSEIGGLMNLQTRVIQFTWCKAQYLCTIPDPVTGDRKTFREQQALERAWLCRS